MAEMQALEQLKSEHAGLELAIKNELARPYPDDDALRELKRRKLQIKDELLKLHAA